MSCALVIPCYNEEKRLSIESVLKFINLNPHFHLVLVNDGSLDGTSDILRDLLNRSNRISRLEFPRNVGKAEAVRRGLIKMSDANHAFVGYADADFATPPQEIARLFQIAQETETEVVLGSRIKMLGAKIVRRPTRHYLGRVFATFASLALRLPVYDTQCGAKVFRNNQNLRASIEHPFLSTWAFDVELIARLAKNRSDDVHGSFREVPLFEWRDIAGSKLGWMDMMHAFIDLWRISRFVRRVKATPYYQN